jgi:16S rRNA (cytosine967-C5)-methyltransferase
MDELGVKELEKSMGYRNNSSNQPAKVVLRVNTLKTTKEV